ncbi:MAG: hypothetical protein GC139_00230 [Sideroxydans sp.]|nr:hypothetical protein [Sideroxydans sp.]
MLASGSKAFACAACGCTLSTNWQTQGITTTPGFSFDLAYSYLNQNQQRYGTHNASATLINSQLAAGQEIEAYTRTQTITASLNYTADMWGISVHVPYISRTHGTYGTTAPLGSSYSDSSSSSIGDIRLVGRYTGFSADRTSGLIGGLKLPTGNTSTYFNVNATTPAGTPLDAGLQIGTGSTDLIFGGFTSGTFSKYGWFVQGTVQHAIATRAALGGLAYRPGDAYALDTGIRYAVFGAKFSPMLQFNIIKRQADSDNGSGTVPLDPVTGVPVSGGTLAYLSPGASVRIGSGVSAYGFVQIPVYQNVNSLQLVPQYTLTLGMRQSFQ